MIRKMLAVILCVALIACLCPSAIAIEAEAKPTVEEILDDYHQRVFEESTKSSGDDELTTTWSNRGDSAMTLEQETVDDLVDAGYEAYNVTAQNYDILEDQLQTDFGAMGLNRDSSYIIVISVEETPNSNSRVIDVPSYDQEDQPAGAYFTHIYGNSTYYMRYVMVTSAGSDMTKDSVYTIEEDFWLENAVTDVFETVLISWIDELADAIFDMALGTIASLISDWSTDDNYSELEPGTLTIHATTTWTAHTVQIWKSTSNRWVTGQSSASAVSQAKCAGFLFDPELHASTWYDGKLCSITHYSPKYSKTTERLNDAAVGYLWSTIKYDCTGDIEFALGTTRGEVIYDNGDPLFVHEETWSVPRLN